MGFGDFWGGSYKLKPGVGDDITRFGDIGDRARAYGESVGLGIGGKTAKSILKNLGKGDFDTNPVIAGFMNPIRNQVAVASRENERRARMGVNAIAPGAQAGLLNAQTNLANQRAQEAGGLAMAEMIPNLYGQASSAFNAARGQRIAAEQNAMSLEAQIAEAINRARMGGMYKTGGFKGILGDVAGIAGAFAGLPGMGGLRMPGMGGGGAPRPSDIYGGSF